MQYEFAIENLTLTDLAFLTDLVSDKLTKRQLLTFGEMNRIVTIMNSVSNYDLFEVPAPDVGAALTDFVQQWQDYFESLGGKT